MPSFQYSQHPPSAAESWRKFNSHYYEFEMQLDPPSAPIRISSLNGRKRIKPSFARFGDQTPISCFSRHGSSGGVDTVSKQSSVDTLSLFGGSFSVSRSQVCEQPSRPSSSVSNTLLLPADKASGQASSLPRFNFKGDLTVNEENLVRQTRSSVYGNSGSDQSLPFPPSSFNPKSNATANKLGHQGPQEDGRSHFVRTDPPESSCRVATSPSVPVGRYSKKHSSVFESFSPGHNLSDPSGVALSIGNSHLPEAAGNEWGNNSLLPHHRSTDHDDDGMLTMTEDLSRGQAAEENNGCVKWGNECQVPFFGPPRSTAVQSSSSRLSEATGCLLSWWNIHNWRNVCQDYHDFDQFLTRCCEQPSICWGVLFGDRSSSFSPRVAKSTYILGTPDPLFVAMYFPNEVCEEARDLGVTYVIPLGPLGGTEQDSGPSTGVGLRDRWVGFSRVLASPRPEKICFNTQFTLLVLHQNLRRLGLSLGVERLRDPKIAAWLCDTDAVEEDLLFSALVGRFAASSASASSASSAAAATTPSPPGHMSPHNQKLWQQGCSSLHTQLRQCAAVATALQPLLRGAGVEQCYTEVEMPLAGMLSQLEAQGIAFAPATLANCSKTLENHMARLSAEAQQVSDARFNIASPEQVSEVLFQHLRLPIPPGARSRSSRPTARNRAKLLRGTLTSLAPPRHPSTSTAVLEEMCNLHPLPAIVLAYRRVAKMMNTYLAALQRHAVLVPPTNQQQQQQQQQWYIFAQWNQCTVVTGRLSSSLPNLQNLPRVGRKLMVAVPTASGPGAGGGGG